MQLQISESAPSPPFKCSLLRLASAAAFVTIGPLLTLVLPAANGGKEPQVIDLVSNDTTKRK
jgi:hypothetical protein